MGTEIFLACISHDPPIVVPDPVGHNNSDSALQQVRELIRDRRELVDVWRRYGHLFTWDRSEQQVAMQFFMIHLECRIGVVDELGQYYDVGFGLPGEILVDDLLEAENVFGPNPDALSMRHLIRMSDNNPLCQADGLPLSEVAVGDDPSGPWNWCEPCLERTQYKENNEENSPG